MYVFSRYVIVALCESMLRHEHLADDVIMLCSNTYHSELNMQYR